MLLVTYVGIITYVVLSITYLVGHGYPRIKFISYQKPLDFFRFVIHRKRSIWKDGLLFFGCSSFFNLILIIFLNVTNIIPAIQTHPYASLFSLPFRIDEPLFQTGSLSTEENLILLIVSFSGPLIFLLYLQLHSKLTIITNDQRYPGSRSLIVYFYVVGISSIVNYCLPRLITIDENINPPEISTSIVYAVLIYGSIAAIIAFLMDRAYTRYNL